MQVNQKIINSLTTNKPVVVHQGGTSSGKTYGILQYLFAIGAQNDNEVITVIAEDVPNLKSGAYRDAKNIWSADEAIKAWWPRENKTDRTFECVNGSIIEFKSFQDEFDARSGKRDRAFFNEANAIKYGIFEQINMRTTKQTIVDFNPSARFWAHQFLEGRDDVEWCVTTFEDNKFLASSIRDKILSYKPTPENIERGTANEYRWKVYGMGELGRLEGLVFPNFKVTSDWPHGKWKTYGMDFGFTNDPSTIVQVRYAHGELYIREHLYKRGLTNQDLAREIRKINPDGPVIADSAEPKSIEELKRAGIWILPAQKGRDSIMYGIQRLSEYSINVHVTSKNVIEEFSSYIWAKNKDGYPTNKPVDNFNHAIDAIRYAVTDRLRRKKVEFSLV